MKNIKSNEIFVIVAISLIGFFTWLAILVETKKENTNNLGTMVSCFDGGMADYSGKIVYESDGYYIISGYETQRAYYEDISKNGFESIPGKYVVTVNGCIRAGTGEYQDMIKRRISEDQTSN